MDAHLAMARWQLATGKPDAARALVDAVTLLHPTARAAWELKATLAFVSQASREPGWRSVTASTSARACAVFPVARW